MPTGDIYYLPSLTWPEKLVNEIEPQEILIIGEPTEEIVSFAKSTGAYIKHYQPERTFRTPIGCTFFRYLNREDGWKMVYNSDGPNTREAVVGGRQQYLENDDPLIYMTETFGFHWENAKYFGNEAKFKIGDSVQIISDRENRIGKIEKIQFVAGAVRYGILTNSGLAYLFEEALMRLNTTPGDSSTWIDQIPSNAEAIALTLTATKLRDPLTDIIYSFQTSRTLFRSYQFKPVLKMLTGASQRILIADEVGLGKTIEAGLIWSELEFRSPLENVLVVCPSILKKKWQNEMLNRFDRRLVELTRERLEEWLSALEDGRPDPIIAVATLESLRISPLLEKMRTLFPKFDLVIVDEAHYLRNSGNKSHALGQDLSDWAENMIFLSATPLNLRSDDLFNLLNLLDSDLFFDRRVFESQIAPNQHINNIARELAIPGTNPMELLPELQLIKQTKLGNTIAQRSDFQKLAILLNSKHLTPNQIAMAKRHLASLNSLANVFTRTRKQETSEDRAVREPIPVIVDWSPLELGFYNAIRKWFVNRAMSTGQIPGFALQNPLRQAASCLPAMIEYMKDRYEFKEDDEDSFDFGADLDPELTHNLLDELVSGLRVLPKIEKDSKYDAFQSALTEALNSVGKQALIFSFFTRTIDYLQKRLTAQGLRVEIMYGKTPADARYQLMQDFRNGKFEILICSEVGSEGLDFEFCNILVNYDLPWNPMRVEQRIGRLDRFGQKSPKIFILNIQIPGTIEDDIFMRLYDRIRLFQDSIGPLEPILRDEIGDLTAKLLNPNLTPEQLEAELLRKNVAWETKKAELNDINTHQNLVAGIDAFLIEGFDDHTPGRGRFIGKDEVELVVSRYFSKYEGSVKSIGDNRHLLIGSQLISTQLRSLGLSTTKGTRLGVANLARELDGRKPGLEVTFDAEVAAKESLELISVRHPLLEVIKNDLVSSEALLSRFGIVCLDDYQKDCPTLVGIYLARASGIRPKLELWTIGVDLSSQELDYESGDKLLQSLAIGRFFDSSSDLAGFNLKKASLKIEQFISEKHRAERDILKKDNEAIVAERKATKKLSLQNKIARRSNTLTQVQRDNRSQSILNIHQSQIRRWNEELAKIDEDSNEASADLELETIAYVVVTRRVP